MISEKDWKNIQQVFKAAQKTSLQYPKMMEHLI